MLGKITNFIEQDPFPEQKVKIKTGFFKIYINKNKSQLALQTTGDGINF